MVGCAAKGSEGAERKEVPISGFQVGTLSWLPKGTDVIAVSFQTKERQRNLVGKTLSHHCWLDRQKGKTYGPPPGARIGEKMNSLLELPEGSSPVNL